MTRTSPFLSVPPTLRLDDGTLHEHVSGEVRREVIERVKDY
jgi:hypothetical protein